MLEIEDLVMTPVEAESIGDESFSELDAPQWAVVSFDDCAASGLTYEEATRLVGKLSKDVAGLCVVTDEAARKMFASSKKRRIVPDDKSEDADKHFTEIL